MKPRREPWKPSKTLIKTIRKIEGAIKKQGYEVESIVPLLNQYSVTARKEGEIFNLRLDKDTLMLVEKFKLDVKMADSGTVRRVYRNKVA